MFFKSLYELAIGEGLLDDFFYVQSRAVRYIIRLGEGTPHILDRIETPEKGKPQIPLMRIPRGEGKGNKLVANFMVENASYVFGWDLPKDSKEIIAEPSNKKTELRFALFKHGIEDALAAQISGSEEVVVLRAILDFLNLPQTERVALIPAEATHMDKFCFRYAPFGPRNAQDYPGIDEYWRGSHNPQGDVEEPTATCAILGTPCVPVRLHTNYVTFPGGLSSGSPVISSNTKKHRCAVHHGLEDNENCPISQSASQAISEALRRLLDKDPTRMVDGVLEHLNRQNIKLTKQITACWWSTEARETNWMNCLEGANLDELKILLQAPRKGGLVTPLDDQSPLNMLFIQATQGRPTFLRYTQRQTREVAANILDFCKYSQGFGIESLLKSVIPNAAGESFHMDPNCTVDLMEAAISRGRIPIKLINAAVHRLQLGRAKDPKMTWKDKRNLALITLALSRNTNLEVPMGLDTTNTNPAYLMGRYLDGRIETVVPVIDLGLQARLAEVVEVLLADDVLASELEADGSWHKVPTIRGLDAQEELHRLAVERVAQ